MYYGVSREFKGVDFVKIKEVSEKTNLTERAIRLYVENGLVAPDINESHSGRRNIVFSDEDVKKLKCISVLRKAGFSIAQIKLMQSEPHKSKEVLQEFIENTKKQIEADSEIVTCLTPLLSCEELSPEHISRSLEKPAIKEKELPLEDSEPSPVQKLLSKLFKGFGAVSFVIAVLCIIPIIRVEIQYMVRYLYPHYAVNNISDLIVLLCFFLAALLPVIIILLNRKSSICSGTKQKIKSFVSVVLVAVCVFCTYYTFAVALFTKISHPEAYVVSRTKKTENYMILDAPEAKGVLLEFLPEELPDTDGIKYDYFYKIYGVWHEPPFTGISVEIPLDEEDFRKTVEYYKAFRPSDSVCDPYEQRDGDWMCVYYRKNYEKAPSNYNPIFQYNEKEKKIRLICEYGQISQKGTRLWPWISSVSYLL